MATQREKNETLAEPFNSTELVAKNMINLPTQVNDSKVQISTSIERIYQIAQISGPLGSRVLS